MTVDLEAIEPRVKEFNAQWAKFKADNPVLVANREDELLAERVARAFWNAGLDWKFHRIAMMHRLGMC